MENKYDIRKGLYDEIGKILSKRKELEVIDLKVSIYKELYHLLFKNNIEYVKDNSLMIPFLLDEIMDKKRASQTYESIVVNVNDLYNLKVNHLEDTKDYKESMSKYNMIVQTLLFDFNKILEQQSNLRDELKDLNSLLPKYRHVKTKFRYSMALDDNDIETLYEIMDKT